MKEKEVNRREIIDSWQMIEQALSRFDVRLNDIENRLSRIEAQQNPQTILEENLVPERSGLLGGRTYLTSQSGGFERLIRVPACDACGERISDDFIVCQSCEKKLCSRCAVFFDNRNYCVECLREELPLTKRAFKVLVCISNNFADTETISELTKMSREDVKASMDELFDFGLITKRGMSIFSRIEATDKGMEAIGAYQGVYGIDPDIILLDGSLRRHLAETRR